jgi:hypothetical protein
MERPLSSAPRGVSTPGKMHRFLRHLPDLNLTEAAHGPEVINAGGEDLFWECGAALSQMPSPD